MEILQRIPFKEKQGDKYYFKNGKWIKTDEEMINSLWHTWVMSIGIERYFDNDGYLIFTYKEIEKAV